MAEDRKEKIRRIFKNVSEGIRHHRDLSGEPVPFLTNWILWMLSLTRHPYFVFYEYHRGDRALRRGTGYCSQYALALWYFLRQEKIKSSLLYFDGHVVASVEPAPGETWLLDGDYHLIVPHSLEEIRTRPELVSQYYRVSPELLTELQRIYQSRMERRTNRMLLPRLYFENLTFLLTWAVPVSLVLYLVWRLTFR